MIERIVIENFKSLRHVDLALGRLNLFIGTNASGKSNFFDALRVLQESAMASPSVRSSTGSRRARPVKCGMESGVGSAKACFAGNDGQAEVSLKVEGRLPGKFPREWTYRIRFTPHNGKVTSEALACAGAIFNSDPITKNVDGGPAFEVCYNKGGKGRLPHLKFERTRPVLGQFAQGNGSIRKVDAEAAEAVALLLANTQRVDPHPAELRRYSPSAPNPAHGRTWGELRCPDQDTL